MRVYWTLFRREFGSYFLSWTGYVVMSGVLMLLGISFVLMLMAYNGDALNAPLTEVFYGTMFFWLIVLLGAPVITMRLFAQEKASGTFETLMTTPVGDLQVVLAKFSAALTFYVVSWLPLILCLEIVHRYTAQREAVEWWPIASTYLGIILLGCLFLSMGCFASALTRSQLIAVMLGLAMGVSLFLLSFLRFSISTQRGWVEKTTAYVAVIDHMDDFARGIVDTRHVVFYLTLSVLFLFLTWKVVEGRRWN